MATVDETKHKAGRMLGLVRFGQALAADSDGLLQEAYLQVYGGLKTEGLAIWPSAGPLPNEVMPHVAALMAFSCAPDKGVSSERYSAILAARNVANPEIRRLTTPPNETVDEPTDY